MTDTEYDNLKRREDLEFVKVEITIPKTTYQLIKDKMYLPVDEDIICKAVRDGKLL